MQQKLASLITDDEFERIELILKEPNIFSALAVNRMEIRHSNFIGYLINPNENHGLNDLVLRKVLRDIFNSSKNRLRNIIDADYIDYSDVEIRREWKNIDILIILKEDVVVIENKIDTTDHSKQLDRYKKIVETTFKSKKKHYVYLTPFGDDPTDEESTKDYINYSYDEISKIIESILNLYRNSLSEKIYFYLSDYLTVLKRELLMDEPFNEDARKIYIKHQAALDFIFNNIPNPISEVVHPLFEKYLKDAGYLIGSRSPKFVRFTTKGLDNFLPKNGSGWREKEAFLFELTFSKNEISFAAVISPGDEALRGVLNNAIEKKHTKLSSKKYIKFSNEKFKFSNLETINEELETKVKARVMEIVVSIKQSVDSINKSILDDRAIKELVNNA